MINIAKKNDEPTNSKKSLTKDVKKASKKNVKKETKKETKKDNFKVQDHILVAKHSILTQKETDNLLNQYKISLEELPRISIKDAAIEHMDLTINNVIRITRFSATVGVTDFYRRVIR